MASMVSVGKGGELTILVGESSHSSNYGSSSASTAVTGGTLITLGVPDDMDSHSQGYSSARSRSASPQPRAEDAPQHSPQHSQRRYSSPNNTPNNSIFMAINKPSVINIDMLRQNQKKQQSQSEFTEVTRQKKTGPPVPPRKLSLVSTSTTFGTSVSSPPVSPASSGIPYSPRLSDDCVSLQDSLQDSAVGSMQGDGKSIASDLSDDRSDVSMDLVDVEEKKDEEFRLCSRVAVYRRADKVVALKLTCRTEEAGNDMRLWELMKILVETATDYFHKNTTVVKLNASQVCKLKLQDGKLAKEHLAELSRTLGQGLTIVQALVRHTPEDGHVGLVVNRMVHHYTYLTIAQEAAIVTVVKLNKYAPAEEFSDQVSEHILRCRPKSLGDAEKIWGSLSVRKAKHEMKLLPKDELLAQMFVFDPTITVLEASKRCFALIVNYELL